jgi:hypothetical protein
LAFAGVGADEVGGDAEAEDEGVVGGDMEVGVEREGRGGGGGGDDAVKADVFCVFGVGVGEGAEVGVEDGDGGGVGGGEGGEEGGGGGEVAG